MNPKNDPATQYYNQQLQQHDANVDKYVQDLISQANGDYDFAAKWIESNYKKAVGTNDADTKAFLSKVASSLEQTVGRIAFDYETGKYRAEEAGEIERGRLESGRQSALARLAQDEASETKNLLRTTGLEKRGLNESLNQRGLLDGGKDYGLAGEENRNLDADVTDRFSALERIFNRDREDTNLNADQGIQDSNITQRRTLEDLTTDSRRGVIDEQDERSMGLDEASRAREKAKREAEAQKVTMKENNKSNALVNTYNKYGVKIRS